MAGERFFDFRQLTPVMCIAGGTAATGADTTTSFIQTPVGGLQLYYGAANSDINFVKDAAGWILPNDNTDNEGGELHLGVIADNSQVGAFKIGTSPAFMAELICKIPDVSDYDIFAFGFRKAEACQAIANIDEPAELITRYTDLAALNVNAGTIYTLTRLNSGAGVATSTTNTKADGVEMKLTVKVSAAGVVTFLIDGAAPTVNTNTLTFDSTDIVVPFLRYTKGAGAASDTPPIIKSLRICYQ